MPLFEYACQTCGELVEVIQRRGESSPQKCGEECVRFDGPMGGGKLLKVMSVPGGHTMGAVRPPPLGSPAPCGSCGAPEGPDS
jgi:putative FmdB family regulatory protein